MEAPQLLTTSPLRTVHRLGTVWYYTIRKDKSVKPKHVAIEQGQNVGHAVFIECQSEDGRMFASYSSIESFVSAVGKTNLNLYEIIVATCKAFFDIEYEGDEEVFAGLLEKLRNGFRDLLGITLLPHHMKISCATGIGENGAFAGKFKRSYHVVINNGYAFASVADVKRFRYLVFGDDARVDAAVYGAYQSFKLIYNSKLGSTRVQLPLDGGDYAEHMATCFAAEPVMYDATKLQAGISTAVRSQRVAGVTSLQSIAPLPPFVGNDVDLHDVRALLHYLPNSGEHSQPWEVFFVIGCVCKNEDAAFEVFHEWASRSEKHVLTETTNLWDSLEKRTDGYSISTLQAMVQKAYPSLFMELYDKYIAQTMMPTVDFASFASHGDPDVYCEPRMLSWLHHARANKHLLVRGAMGLGKTYRLREMLADLKPSSVLIVTPRQLFARSMLGTFRDVLPGLAIYKDVRQEDRRKLPFMVCQLESLWSVRDNYEVVILDESESILYQFSSPTMQHFREVATCFEKIVCSAAKVLWTDAFLSDRSILVAERLDPHAAKVFISNVFKPTGRRAYEMGSYAKAKPSVMQLLAASADKKNVVVSASKDLANAAAKALKYEPPARGEAKPPGDVLLLTSETSDKTKALLEDVNGLLVNYRHFIYTSALTVGTSFDVVDHFDNLVLYTSANSNNIRDSMQASMRVRTISTNNLYYATYPRYFGTQRFDVFSRGRLQNIIDGREEHAIKSALVTSDPILAAANQNHAKLAKWLKILWACNTQENNVSAFLHTRMLRAFLVECGYELVDTPSREDHLVEDIDAHVTSVDFFEIPDASDYDTLGKLIESGQATAEDKLRWLKAHFITHVVRDASELAASDAALLRGMFEYYAKNQLQVKRLMHNIKAEHIGVDHEGLPAFQNNQAQKLEVIKMLTDSLGITSTMEIGKQIERTVMETSASKVLDLKRDIQQTFDLRFRETSKVDKQGARKTNLQRGLEIINQVFTRWGFTEVAAAKRSRKRTAAGMVDTNNFVVKERKEVVGYAHHAKLQRVRA